MTAEDRPAPTGVSLGTVRIALCCSVDARDRATARLREVYVDGELVFRIFNLNAGGFNSDRVSVQLADVFAAMI